VVSIGGSNAPLATPTPACSNFRRDTAPSLSICDIANSSLGSNFDSLCVLSIYCFWRALSSQLHSLNDGETTLPFEMTVSSMPLWSLSKRNKYFWRRSKLE
jgi:hypothetical protein